MKEAVKGLALSKKWRSSFRTRGYGSGILLVEAYLFVRFFHISAVQHEFLSVLENVEKDLFHKSLRSCVARGAAAVSVPMLEGQRCIVVLSRVRSRRRKLIANALDGILIRHHRMLGAVLIKPILYVMLVSALMMKPCAADALLASCNADGRSCSLIISYTLEKLRRGELRQIVN